MRVAPVGGVRWIMACLAIGALSPLPARGQGRAAAVTDNRKLLFEERFEDTNWTARGWYDSPHFQITASEHRPGSDHSCVWHWKKAGDVSPEGGAARVRLPPVDNVTLDFFIKHSADWKWTGVGYHPHELHFLTDADPAFVGPAYTCLTLYVEVVNGVPRVAIQDGKNIDAARIGQNLVGVTEKRSVAGGNGDSDGYGNLGHYRLGQTYMNGKYWEPKQKYFRDESGPYYKGDWHHVQATFKLNNVLNGIGQRDGVLQYRYDGKLILDLHDVVFRTGQYPKMRINQLLMAPYFGPGVPQEQSIWIDDLRIYTDPAPPRGSSLGKGHD